jgi:V/A-type H+-transporting ATPase subunit I
MIVPMKKFYLIVLDKDRGNVPERLRKLGVAHVEELQGSGETYQSLERERAETESVCFLLQNYNKKKSKPDPSKSLSRSDIAGVKSLVQEVSELKHELDSLGERTNQLVREMDRVASWGDVSVAALVEVDKGSGRSLRFFEAPLKEMASLPKELEYMRLQAPKGKFRFGLVLGDGEKLPELPPSFQEFLLPELSLTQMRREIVSIDQRKKEIARAFKDLSVRVTFVKMYLQELEADIVLERLRSGMPDQEHFAYLQGYVPARDCDKFKKIVAKYGWAIAFNDPSDEENPPTLVENPPAIRIIEPVFEFLGTVPNYREYDISLWFLLFFSLFFAMIFGDGGYGSLIVLASLASIIMGKRKGRPVGDAQKLFLLLGAVTVVWGALTASWFGIQFNHLPSLLQRISLNFINGQSPDSESNIKVFCFIIGLVQLSIAHLKNIRRDFPNLKFLSQIGSLLLLVGMFNAALNLVIDATRFPLRSWVLICIAIGFSLVFLFGNWNGKFGSSLLESLKGIIPTFLGTVSVFADIVSYIRLWAVGLAGLAISQTVNGMASGILGGAAGFLLGFILKLLIAIVLLLVSHSLNFVLTVLSVVVHGIRLNMLEFSGHLGMEWSGYKYNPLREQKCPSAAMESSLEEIGV